MALTSAMSNLSIKQDQIWNSESKLHTANWDVAETHEANIGGPSIAKPQASDGIKHYSKSAILSERDRLIEEQIANFQTLKPEEQTNELRSLFMGDTDNLSTLRPTDLSQSHQNGQKYHTQSMCGHEEPKNLHIYHQNNGYNLTSIDDSFKENYYAKSVVASKFKNYSNNNTMYPNYTSNVPNYFNALRVNKDSHWTYNQNDYRARSHLNYQEELNKARIAFYLNSQEQLNKEQLALAACFAQSDTARMNNVCDDHENKAAETDLNALPISTTEGKNENDSEGVRGDKCQKACNFKGCGLEGDIDGVKNDSRDGSPFEKYPSSNEGQSDGESEGGKARRGSLEDVMADFRANGWDTEANSLGVIQQTDTSGTNLNLSNPLLTRHAYSRHQSYPPTRNTLPEPSQGTLKTAASADQMDLFRLLLAHQQNSAVNRVPSGLQNLNGTVPRTWSDNSARFQPLSNAANPLFNLASQNLVSFPPSSHTPSVANNVIVPGLNFNAQAELIQANLLNGFQGHYKKREKRTVQAECGFCRNNGEQPFLYKNHSLKDATGRVLCPILRDFRCPNCDATGDHAHTIKYCPQAGSQDAVPSLTQLRNLRMANGRRRFPPFSAIENQPKWFQS